MEGDRTLLAYANDAGQDATDIWCAQRSDSRERTTESTADDATAESGDDVDVCDDRDNNYYGPLYALIADDDDDLGSDAVADATSEEDGPRAFAYEGPAAGDDDDDATYGDWSRTDDDDATWPLQSYETPSAQDNDALPSDIGDLLPAYQDLEDTAVDAHASDNVNLLGHYDPAFNLFYANVLASASPIEILPNGNGDDGDDSTAIAMDAIACLDETPTSSDRPSSADSDTTEQGIATVCLDGLIDDVPVDATISSDASEDVAVAQSDTTQVDEPVIEPCVCTSDTQSPTPDVEQCVAIVDSVGDGSCGPEADPDATRPLAAAEEMADETSHDIATRTTAKPDLSGDVSNVGDSGNIGDNDDGVDDDDADQLVIASFDPINVPTPSAALDPDALMPEKEEEKKADPGSEPNAGACAHDGNNGDQALPSEESTAPQAAADVESVGASADASTASEPVETGAAPSTDLASSSSSSSSWWSPWSWWSGKAAPAGTASAASDARLKAPGLVLTKADLDSVKLRPVSNRGPRPPVSPTPDGVLGQLLGLFGGIAAASASDSGSSNGVDNTRPPSVRALVAAMEGVSTHSA
ncbi:hypothetical protein pmac_cds_577 [Pandoravirus macleodensis]|uniref:Uncharacterized protein n=1 Tax=Pandoravirus macleodensis TaxID=2107707 RepID=A0A2U7UFV7_9VIRU|nr:hypothetical protein pmac_cds_577 [Pandoravirus macleodensis]AVK77265.1 hypothetical protein pmac_cds_577 [Pandoravirus macleodensis]